MTEQDQPTPPANLCLPARLDTDAADQLRDAFLNHRGQDLQLEAPDVLHLGARCLAVLLAATRMWQADAHELTLGQTSDALLHDLDRMGATVDMLSTTQVAS